MSLLRLKGLKIKLTTKHLCVSSDCTRTPLLISLGKIITNNFVLVEGGSLPPSSFPTGLSVFCFKPEVLLFVE